MVSALRHSTGSKEKDRAMVDSNRLVSFFIAFLTFSYFSKTFIFFTCCSRVAFDCYLYLKCTYALTTFSEKRKVTNYGYLIYPIIFLSDYLILFFSSLFLEAAIPSLFVIFRR